MPIDMLREASPASNEQIKENEKLANPRDVRLIRRYSMTRGKLGWAADTKDETRLVYDGGMACI